jgi:hypothetical protein
LAGPHEIRRWALLEPECRLAGCGCFYPATASCDIQPNRATASGASVQSTGGQVRRVRRRARRAFKCNKG